MKTEPVADGAPFYFAMQEPPTATAIDDDIYLAVTTGMPDRPGEVEVIDIILSVEYAEAAIARLSAAVRSARRNERV